MPSKRIVYMNGKFIPEIEAKISIFDSSLMFGDMVYEMTRSFNKKQFKLRDHLERLYAGIKILHIPVKMTIDEMERACYDTIEKNEPFFKKTDEHRLMIDVSRGPLGIYHYTVFDWKVQPTVIISDVELKWTVAHLDLFDCGINAVVPNQRSIPAHLLEPKMKNRSRINLVMADNEVANWKGDNNWALLVDPDGFISEGTGDNFFMVKDGIVYTSEPRNILRGISRKYIFEICNQLGIKCIEKNIEMYDVYTADEAFMTATPFCILPVTRFMGLEIGDAKMGKITKKLLDTWGKNVGVDIPKQIKDCAREVAELTKRKTN